MARLNEPPVSTDSLETLRRKLLRQNRDLAKSNNLRALRIRELENDCACMLSENIQLRGRILELERQAEDNESRRIADHALAIKAKLESQLTEWGEMIANLGLEPPAKRHSPGVGRVTKRRTSFNFTRISPSQRRLRDVAKDVEDLGHINEYKTYSRKSMNPEQIHALRSEADLADSPEIGPPPVSQFISDPEPTKFDSPQAASPIKHIEQSPKRALEPPVALPSPQADKTFAVGLPSPEKIRRDPVIKAQESESDATKTSHQDSKPQKSSLFQEMLATPTKSGKKRKLASRDEPVAAKPMQENQPPRVLSGKPSIRDRTGGKTLKELTNMRKDFQEPSDVPRKPLAAKSTNDDVSSPKKSTKPGKQPAKSDALGAKPALPKPRGRPRNAVTVKVEPVPVLEAAPVINNVEIDLGKPLAEPELLSPNSPEHIPPVEAPRGDTPPPADISCMGETSRPSRRNRTSVSYAEPNLRDKMRRPTKDLVNAVVDRRSSQLELIGRESFNMKQQDSDMSMAAKETESSSIPASPLANKGVAAEERPIYKTTKSSKRSSTATKAVETTEEVPASQESLDTISSTDVDVYEVIDSSPQPEVPAEGRRKTTKGRSSRRFSSSVESDDTTVSTERSSSRRRSMMV